MVYYEKNCAYYFYYLLRHSMNNIEIKTTKKSTTITIKRKVSLGILRSYDPRFTEI
jgi:hypothetical protein